MFGGLVWSLGSFIATRPRPLMKATITNPLLEWSILRWWARLSQPMWCVGIGLGVWYQISDSISSPLLFAAGAFILAGLIGWWPLMIIQSNLAYWASDTDLANRLRHASWGVGIGLSLGTGVFYVIGDSWCGGLIGSILFFAAWAGPIFVSLGYVMLSLWQLWRMACWVTLNKVNESMRDDRLRARAMQASVPVKPL
jgi:hypothetical protein